MVLIASRGQSAFSGPRVPGCCCMRQRCVNGSVESKGGTQGLRGLVCSTQSERLLVGDKATSDHDREAHSACGEQVGETHRETHREDTSRRLASSRRQWLTLPVC
eukprot:7685734-Lingulodinium_polyedra.AAC.1